MGRWVIEAAHAHIKNVFSFFRHTIEGRYVPKIFRFFRIVAAIVNCFFPPLLKNTEFHENIIRFVQEQAPSVNPFRAELEEKKLWRMTLNWILATADTVEDFPRLTMEELKILTLGPY